MENNMFDSEHKDVGLLPEPSSFPSDLWTICRGIPTKLRERLAGEQARRRTISWSRLAGSLAVSVFLGLPAHAADVDVALVFAVDFSSSIDPGTADLQREGHAAALTSPDIITAISQNYFGCISVTYFEWSSPGHIRPVLPWTSICGLEDAKAAALVIRKKGDNGYSRSRRGTSISSAIDVASLLLDQFPGKAMKKVIDISSNGENNDGLPVGPSRVRAIAKGYTINAIAIPAQNDDSDRPLASYFADNVIGGPEAFVIKPTGPGDYVTALRRKLVTEISMNVDSQLGPLPSTLWVHDLRWAN
jgi:hypothetical protein